MSVDDEESKARYEQQIKKIISVLSGEESLNYSFDRPERHYTLLNCSIAHNRPDLTRELIAKGANTAHVSRFGTTALFVAAEKSHSDLAMMVLASLSDSDQAQLLNQALSDPDLIQQPDKKKTSLDFAKQNNHQGLIDLLSKKEIRQEALSLFKEVDPIFASIAKQMLESAHTPTSITLALEAHPSRNNSTEAQFYIRILGTHPRQLSGFLAQVLDASGMPDIAVLPEVSLLGAGDHHPFQKESRVYFPYQEIDSAKLKREFEQFQEKGDLAALCAMAGAIDSDHVNTLACPSVTGELSIFTKNRHLIAAARKSAGKLQTQVVNIAIDFGKDPELAIQISGATEAIQQLSQNQSASAQVKNRS